MEFLKFVHFVEKLKNIKRSGWKRVKIPHPESVADHSFSVAMLAMTLASKAQINQEKAIKMALIHDLGEAITGDIVTISPDGDKTLPNLQDKLLAEDKAVKEIIALLDDKEEYLKLYNEFKKNETPLANFVNELDKLELGLQANEYEKKYAIPLEEFMVTTRLAIKNPILKEIVAELDKVRKH